MTTNEGGVLSLVGGIRAHSVTNVTSDVGVLDEVKSFLTDFEFLVEFGGEVFVSLGGLFEGGVLGLEIRFPSSEVGLSDGDEVLGLFDLVVGGIQNLVLGGNVTLESEDIFFLGVHVFGVVDLIDLLLGGEGGEGVFEVVLNVVHEVTDLSDGITVGELGAREGNEGLDEGGLNGVLELLLDLSEGVLGLLNLDEGSLTSLEGEEESEGLIEGSDSFGVLNGLLFEFGVLLLSDGGLILDVLSGLLDSVVEVGDIGLEVLLLDVEDGLEESFAVGDISIGGVDFTIESSNLIGVLNGSLVIGSIGSLELSVKVIDNFLNGGDQLVKRALGHHVQLSQVDDD